MPRKHGKLTERKIIISEQSSNDSDSVEIKDPLHLSKQQILFLLGRGKKRGNFCNRSISSENNKLNKNMD